MNRIAMAAIVILTSGIQTGFGRPIPARPTAQHLLEAPVVLCGEVKEFPGEPRTLDMEEEWQRIVRAQVLFRIHGVVDAGEVMILETCASTPSLANRRLQLGKRYIFFLKGGQGPTSYEGVDKYETGLPTDDMSWERFEGLGKERALKLTAQKNLASVDESVASRWADFLADLYEHGDEQLFLQQLASPHVGVRGIALASLCRHVAMTPALYAQTMEFLKETAPLDELFGIRRRIIDGVASNRRAGLSNDQVRDWLRSDLPGVPAGAVALVRRTKNVEMIAEVIDLMRRTPNIDLQYDCISALSAIERRSHGITHESFKSDPKKYIREAMGRHGIRE